MPRSTGGSARWSWATTSGSFTSGPVGGTLRLTVGRETQTYQLVATDQRGGARPAGIAGDIGAIER